MRNDIVFKIIELVFLLVMPAVILYLTKKFAVLQKIGPIVLCYALGFVLALLPIGYDKDFSQTIASALIALAIPLLLFGFDVKSIKKLAKTTLFSFCLLIISVIVVSAAATVIAEKQGINDAPSISGMAVGLYIGGTPNLFAIGKALLRENVMNTINAANLADSLIGSIYFLLLITVIKPVYSHFLGGTHSQTHEVNTSVRVNDEYDFSLMPKNKKGVLRLVGTVLLAAVCLGLGILLELLINGSLDGSLYIMITVSVLGIVIGLIRPVRETKGTYQAGQYLILIFSMGLSMSIDMKSFASGILPAFIYFGCIQVCSLLMHLLLCRIFKIDGGTAIITSTAGIYGPPFIAPVANAYGDKKLIVPGVICGTFGLITGNLFGIIFALIIGKLI